MKLTGFAAIEYAEKAGLSLNKAADRIDGAATRLSAAEASAIADGDPEAIWLDVPDEEYYGEPKNMEPGQQDLEAMATEPQVRRAGQRSDELRPVQSNAVRSPGAAGTPGGGLAAGGLAGVNAGDGTPDEQELAGAMQSGVADQVNDDPDANAESGPAGGAVGGTPAGKRARHRRVRGLAPGNDYGGDATIGRKPAR